MALELAVGSGSSPHYLIISLHWAGSIIHQFLSKYYSSTWQSTEELREIENHYPILEGGAVESWNKQSMPTPFEEIRDEIAARINRLNNCITVSEMRRRERKARVKDALTDYARVFILHGDRVHRDWRMMIDLWCMGGFITPYPPSVNQFAAVGGARAVYRRIAEGGLGVDDQLGIWTGGFFKGLRMSGALRPYRKRQWAIWENTHRDLIRDMEEMEVFNKFERASGRNGIRRLRRCPASFLPAESDGASVVAGVLAGSHIREVEDENWIEVAGEDEVVRLLDGWGILWRKGFMYRGRPTILVPPFYAPLFCNFLPPYTLERLSSIKRPALCPFLPAIYWDIVLREANLPVIPFTDALPYSCSMRTFRRRGWKRGDLHLMGVRLGISVVEQRLQGLMRSWYDSQVKLKAEGGSKIQDEMDPVITDPGNAIEQGRIGIGAENIGGVMSSQGKGGRVGMSGGTGWQPVDNSPGAGTRGRFGGRSTQEGGQIAKLIRKGFTSHRVRIKSKTVADTNSGKILDNGIQHNN